MNRFHHLFCRSGWWRKTIQERVPWALGGTDLGSNVLEIGPGPGLTTDLLRENVSRLTVLELDPELAASLKARLAGSSVEVVVGDATAMPFRNEQFSAVVSFNMLHHVPSQEFQDRLLREAWRVLRPGGVFAGTDSRDGFVMRLIHAGDTLVPVDPDRFADWLQTAGFTLPEITKASAAFRFRALRPPQKESR